MKDLQQMAFKLAIRKNLPHQFSTEKAAGRKWLRLFFKRHPEQSMRRPRPLSIARIRDFTRKNVETFFCDTETGT
jgi:hypothetical protein